MTEKILSGEISVVELVKEHIKLAKEIQEKTNAFITIFDGETNKDQYDPLLHAQKLDELIKSSPPKAYGLELLGIPFTVKDLYLVENTRTTFGSKLMEEFVAPYTSTVVQKCLDAGAILIGKTNCDPWGFGSTGENSGYGPTKNPHNLDYVPGGSSSGSPASLAAGVGFFSLGTDTGGSVRLPAALCGLYSIKPTYGRNSRFGIGVMGSSFDTPGFFARHAEDIELLEGIMEGKDEHDPTTFEHSQAENSKSEIRNSKNYNLQPTTYTIGIPKEFFGDGLDPEIRQMIDSKIEKYKQAGHEIKEVSLSTLEYGLAAYYILVPAEISANRARYDGVRYGKFVSEDYVQNMIESRSKYFEDEVKRRIMIGTYVLSAGYSDQFYKKASKVRSKLKREFEKIFKEVDFIVAPAIPSKAPKLGENNDDPLKNYLLDIYNVTANLAGIPAIAIPLGFGNDEMPIGMQIMGNWFCLLYTSDAADE